MESSVARQHEISEALISDEALLETIGRLAAELHPSRVRASSRTLIG